MSFAAVATGLGVFLEGQACTGSVVSLVPGVFYLRTQYRHMPNFPKIDIGNPYLSSRYDMTIIDSKPWGQGAGSETSTGGFALSDAVVLHSLC